MDRSIDETAGGLPASNDGAELGDDGGSPQAGVDFSNTNVQEAGIDEPDQIKTDGERILAIAGNSLHLIDASGMTAELRGSLELPAGSYGSQMFLFRDRVLVIAHTDMQEVELSERPSQWETGYEALTQLVEVDISQPDDLKIVSIETLGGRSVAARMIDGVVRVVLHSEPNGLDLVSWQSIYEGVDRGSSGSDPDPAPLPEPQPEPQPEPGSDGNPGDGATETGSGTFTFRSPNAIEDAKAEARAHNEQVLAAATAEDWLPQYVSDKNDSLEVGLLYGCERAMRPGVESGLGVLSVLTYDLDEGMTRGEGVGVFSSGEQVYASADGLYIATRPWGDWPSGGDDAMEGEAVDQEGDTQSDSTEGESVPGTGEADDETGTGGSAIRFRAEEDYKGYTSYLHKFDISSPERADYTASGSFRGWLLNRWSMSEYQGVLRMATTDVDLRGNSPQESFVTTFEESEGALVQLGQVRGLGSDESIYAVRFMGDTAYVVTFRTTDPLYTVDLSDPAAPTVLGELKISGYSAYLHPLDADHLIGVGQDATEDGQTLGTQISLFDVSDKSDPKRLHQFTLGSGYSSVEYDDHAFLYWSPEDLVVIPVETWDGDGEGGSFTGVLALRITVQDGIQELAKLEHREDGVDGGAFPTSRAMVLSERLFTLSDAGLLGSSLDDFTALSWTAF